MVELLDFEPCDPHLALMSGETAPRRSRELRLQDSRLQGAPLTLHAPSARPDFASEEAVASLNLNGASLEFTP